MDLGLRGEVFDVFMWEAKAKERPRPSAIAELCPSLATDEDLVRIHAAPEINNETG